jgi:hypothetical protein
MPEMEQEKVVVDQEIVYYDTMLDKNCVKLLTDLLSGDLIARFLGVTRNTPMPIVPDTFNDHTHYQKIFEPLFQYEVYCRLLPKNNDTYSHMAIGEQNEDPIHPIAKAGKVMQYWIAELVDKKIDKKKRKD